MRCRRCGALLHAGITDLPFKIGDSATVEIMVKVDELNLISQRCCRGGLSDPSLGVGRDI